MATGPLIAIVGETASGKTALAIELAEKFDGEIICADSRTVYRGMNIGTAKPTASERSRVPHYLLDVVEPDEPFTVADFKRLANEAIDDIAKRGKLPIMVGGSGLYVDAVLYDFGFSPDNAARDEVNPRHVSSGESGSRKKLRKNTLVLGLNLEREVLGRRISQRVDAMVEGGMVEETKRLIENYPNSKALDAPGYKAFRGYIEGLLDLEQAKALFVQNDMKLAKRQRTWFKRNNSIHWIRNRDEIVDITTTFLSKITDPQDNNLLQ